MRKILFSTFFIFFLSSNSFSNPIISGISTNEINIDTKFNGAQILLFGAKGTAGNIVITVRGPKKDFLVTRKSKIFGVWFNGKRTTFKDAYSFYSLFSTFKEGKSDQEISDQFLENLELGKNNLEFKKEENFDQNEEFQLQLIEKLEKNKLYSKDIGSIDFLDEKLFKVMLDFPKNITRGIYNVEIYLIQDGNLVSFQTIPIYVNQVGLSAQILDFANQEAALYGFLTIAIAFIVGWLTNYLFIRFVGK
jgi:uncharacterized protein (TIGR02186 family)